MFEDLFAFIRLQYDDVESIPLHAPVLGELEKKWLSECIDSTFVSSVGPHVDEFERRLCKVTGRQYAIATVNGTAALHLGLKISGVAHKTEVLMQPLTFIATANAVKYCGGQVVFIDIDRETLGICPVSLKKWLSENTQQRDGICFNKTTGREVKACLCMHTFGHPSKLDELLSVCQQFNIQFFEDAAEALGSDYKNHHVGTHGCWSALSFNGNKVMTTGGGGALLTDDKDFADKARHMATTAKSPHAWETCHDLVGFNFRMPNLNAALGCAQLERLPVLLKDKRALALSYKEFFTHSRLEFINEPKSTKSNFWLNAVLCENTKQRDKLLEAGHKQGIYLRPAWQLLCDSAMYSQAQAAELSVARDIAARLVNLPSSARVRPNA